MYILGVQLGHDSGAALLGDGRILADVAEERFLRIKHYSGLPFRSIEYCLQQQGITGLDLDVVAFSSSLPSPMARLPFSGPAIEAAFNDMERRAARPGWEESAAARRFGLPLYLRANPLSPGVEVDFVEHHEAHAASAYYLSGRPLDERMIVATMDGVGGGVSCAIWRGEAGRLEPLMKVGTPGSLGWFYSNVTEGLGWWHSDGEGKTMGLAPYGDARKVRGVFDGHYPRFEGGELVAPYAFGPLNILDIAGAHHYHMEDGARFAELTKVHRREDLAAEAQEILEREVMSAVLPWLRRENTRTLACAGGVFLNVKLNQRIWYSGACQHQIIYPNAGDSGLAVGAALRAYHRRHPGAPLGKLEHLSHGPEYPDAEIEQILELRRLDYQRVDDVCDEVARALADDKIVGWFQGRMESGPRALGNRSILMSANRAENKDRINARVKFREGFRPFCPSLLAEARDQYLRAARDEAFMVTSFDVTDAKRASVPAVVHVDGTLRPQTVRPEANPLLHQLLSRFRQYTGESLLLNTSFNIMGEPIVCDPREAIRGFFDGGMDLLALGPYLVRKPR